MQTYDSIVLGLGGMGSSALWHLAGRGFKVLGIDQFGIAHDRGSSHGGSRLIRRAYFEHPDYVPLVSKAYEIWGQLEEAAGKTLFHRTGLFLCGPPDGAVVAGVRLASNTHRLSIEEVSRDHARLRFPGFTVPEQYSILYEPHAGFLEVENCVRAQIEQAARLGAQIRTGLRVIGWKADQSGASVETDGDTFWARTLILCGGAWSSSLLASARIPLEVLRKVVVWYTTAAPGYRLDSCPVFCFDTAAGFFYGFPSFDGHSVKVGEHSGGQAIAAPELLDRSLHDADRKPLDQFIAAYLTYARSPIVKHSVCMYTMTPDQHFVVDRHPQHDNVFIACGFSGHGFKFAPVLGSVLADLATVGGTDEPIAFLRWPRPKSK